MFYAIYKTCKDVDHGACLMKLLTFTLLALSLSACALTTEREQPGDSVVLASNEPVDCQDLGTFYGSGKKPERALNSLLNAIGEHGGNRAYVTSEEIIESENPLANTIVFLNDENIVYGRGFKCPV
jgi:hypothetical protein